MYVCIHEYPDPSNRPYACGVLSLYVLISLECPLHPWTGTIIILFSCLEPGSWKRMYRSGLGVDAQRMGSRRGRKCGDHGYPKGYLWKRTPLSKVSRPSKRSSTTSSWFHLKRVIFLQGDTETINEDLDSRTLKRFKRKLWQNEKTDIVEKLVVKTQMVDDLLQSRELKQVLEVTWSYGQDGEGSIYWNPFSEMEFREENVYSCQ